MLSWDLKGKRRMRNLIACVLLFMPANLPAMPKFWFADEAELIVVGTLGPGLRYPWWDGWHLPGVLSVDEVLYGKSPGPQLKLELVFSWQANVEWWPLPAFARPMLEKAIWCLNRVDEKTWEATGSPYFPGVARLRERAEWEEYIRKYKK